MLLFFISCDDKQEDDDGWNICAECDIESWIGLYTGTSSHYEASTNRTEEGLAIEIEIVETATDYLTVYLKQPQNNYFATLSGDFVTPYAISFASSTKSIMATLKVKDGEFRLTGNSKKFHVTYNDSTIIKEVVNFDVYK